MGIVQTLYISSLISLLIILLMAPCLGDTPESRPSELMVYTPCQGCYSAQQWLCDRCTPRPLPEPKTALTARRQYGPARSSESSPNPASWTRNEAILQLAIKALESFQHPDKIHEVPVPDFHTHSNDQDNTEPSERNRNFRDETGVAIKHRYVTSNNKASVFVLFLIPIFIRAIMSMAKQLLSSHSADTNILTFYKKLCSIVAKIEDLSNQKIYSRIQRYSKLRYRTNPDNSYDKLNELKLHTGKLLQSHSTNAKTFSLLNTKHEYRNINVNVVHVFSLHAMSLSRLRSYRFFPNSGIPDSVSVSTLAMAGFVYRGVGTSVTCEGCNQSYDVHQLASDSSNPRYHSEGCQFRSLDNTNDNTHNSNNVNSNNNGGDNNQTSINDNGVSRNNTTINDLIPNTTATNSNIKNNSSPISNSVNANHQHSNNNGKDSTPPPSTDRSCPNTSNSGSGAPRELTADSLEGAVGGLDASVVNDHDSGYGSERPEYRREHNSTSSSSNSSINSSCGSDESGNTSSAGTSGGSSDSIARSSLLVDGNKYVTDVRTVWRENLFYGLDIVETECTTERRKPFRVEPFDKGMCLKNPGHYGYFRLLTPTLKSIPGYARCLEFLKFMKLASYLTVRIVVGHTSSSRPAHWSPAEQKGIKYRTGTGSAVIEPVFGQGGEEVSNCNKGHSTPSPSSSKPKRAEHHTRHNSKGLRLLQKSSWETLRKKYTSAVKMLKNGHSSEEIYIETSRHLVFDDAEAAHTTVEFFFDSTDRNGVVSLKACKVLHDGSLEGSDRSLLVVRTSDVEFVEKLRTTRRDLETIVHQFPNSIKVGVVGKVFVFHHPHGAEKVYSFGQSVTNKYRVNYESAESPRQATSSRASSVHAKLTKITNSEMIPESLNDTRKMLLYVADTCPGSSGAPVFTFTSAGNDATGAVKDFRMTLWMHQGREKDGLINISTCEACDPTDFIPKPRPVVTLLKLPTLGPVVRMRDPVFPAYAPLQKRIDSFASVSPTTFIFDVTEMARGGFFYAGYRDCVRCYYCGIGLKGWQPGDNMYVQHRNANPECHFLILRLRVLGQNIGNSGADNSCASTVAATSSSTSVLTGGASIAGAEATPVGGTCSTLAVGASIAGTAATPVGETCPTDVSTPNGAKGTDAPNTSNLSQGTHIPSSPMACGTNSNIGLLVSAPTNNNASLIGATASSSAPSTVQSAGATPSTPWWTLSTRQHDRFPPLPPQAPPPSPRLRSSMESPLHFFGVEEDPKSITKPNFSIEDPDYKPANQEPLLYPAQSFSTNPGVIRKSSTTQYVAHFSPQNLIIPPDEADEAFDAPAPQARRPARVPDGREDLSLRLGLAQAENARLQRPLLCKVCHEESARELYLPCGHMDSCTKCTDLISNCPTCCARILASVKVYFA